MPGSDVGQCAHGEAIVAGDSASHPGVGRQIAEEGQSRGAYRAEIFDVAGPGEVVGAGAGGADVLIVAGKRSIEAACEPESAKDEGALGVVNVVQDFTNGPLFGCIPVQGLLLRDASAQGESLFSLGAQERDNIVRWDLIDI